MTNKKNNTNWKNENVYNYYKESMKEIERQAREDREALYDLCKARPLSKVLGIRI